MSGKDNTGVGDAVFTAAAAGLLAVSAVAARPTTDASDDDRPATDRPAAGQPPTDRPGDTTSDAVDRYGVATHLRLDEPGIKGRIEKFQGTHPPVAFVFGVIKRFGEDRGSRLAALVAYYGFFSLFPAMLAMVTILGFVLDGHPDLRKTIEDSALSQFPVIGNSIGSTAGSPLTGSTVALIIGLAGALWAGLGAMQASQEGLNTVWHIPQSRRPTFFKKRARSLAALVVLALLFAVNAVVPQITGAFTSGPVGFVLLLAASIAVDALAFLVMFQILIARKQRWNDLWVGAVVAGAAYAVLQTFGTLYVERTLKNASDTYGTFNGVIALLSWLFLLAQVTMFATVINVVRAEHAWPRSLYEPANSQQGPNDGGVPPAGRRAGTTRTGAS